jgi:hypothetical protein
MLYEYYNFPMGITEDWQKLFDISQSYRRAISTLINEERRQYYSEEFGGVKSERDVFPILFLIHTWLELALKAVVLANTTELDFKGLSRISHNLLDLEREARKYCKKLKISSSVRMLIEFLNTENTPKGSGFKYNFDKDGRELYVNAKEGVARGVDLRLIVVEFEELDDHFEKLFTYFSECFYQGRFVFKPIKGSKLKLVSPVFVKLRRKKLGRYN